MATLIGEPNLEAWAGRVIREGVISERAFLENLPRIGRLSKTYGIGPLRELLVKMTTSGISFGRTLTLLEEGNVPPEMRDSGNG